MRLQEEESLPMTETRAIPKKPEIVTELPGPKVRALIQEDHRYISPSYTRGYPFAIARGEGAMVQDPDGNWFLDFNAGIAVCSTGHCHPQVVKAIQEQAARFLHMSGTDFYYENMVELARRLDESAPGETPKKVFFCNSGAEAIEGALKLARHHTGRPNIISFYRSFHGRTYGAMSVTASKAVQRGHFAPLLGNIFHAHYPYSYRPFFGNTNPEDEAEACLEFIKSHLFQMVTQPSEVAAILVEPIQGEGGYVVPPKNWLPGLRKLCDAHGIVLIVDEVQAGIGRTGKMWATEYDGIEPDIITSAKGLASGMPLGAIIAKSNVMTWKPGAHATTFGGNPVACAAALATLDAVENGLMQNAAQQGQLLMARLSELVKQYDQLGEVRGRGLMVGLEIVQSKSGKAKDGALRDLLVDKCFEKGLLILGCGENTIRFSPPLVIDADDVETAVSIFEAVLKENI